MSRREKQDEAATAAEKQDEAAVAASQAQADAAEGEVAQAPTRKLFTSPQDAEDLVEAIERVLYGPGSPVDQLHAIRDLCQPYWLPREPRRWRDKDGILRNAAGEPIE